MCLIIARRKGGTVDWDAADLSAYYNDDGYGIAYHRKGRIRILKSLKWDEVRDRALELEAKDQPFVLHQRLTTHGATSQANCHPFKVEGHGAVMAHNGIISTLDVPRGKVDSQVLAELLSTLPKGFLDDAKLKPMLHHIIGSSRLAFMFKDGSIAFFNEDLGAWHQGVWYSQAHAITRTKGVNTRASWDPNCWGDQGGGTQLATCKGTETEYSAADSIPYATRKQLHHEHPDLFADPDGDDALSGDALEDTRFNFDYDGEDTMYWEEVARVMTKADNEGLRSLSSYDKAILRSAHTMIPEAVPSEYLEE